jgi:hypothetical protein
MSSTTTSGRPRAGQTARASRIWRRCFPTRLALLIAALTCIVAPVALITVHIHENPMFSPTDEVAHWDYVTRLANGGFPRMGQFLQPATLHELECQGTALHGLVLPPCGTVAPIRDFPGSGYQYEAQQPPGYYAMTVPLRWIAIHGLGLDDVTATRLWGMAWLVLGLLLFWAACRLMNLPPSVAGAGALLIATGPAVIYQSSYVSNDVPAVMTGSLVMLLGALAWKHPGRWMTPVMLGGGVVIASIKLNDFLPIVVSAILFGMLAVRRRDQSVGTRQQLAEALRWWWPRSGALVVGGLVSAVTWLIVEQHLAIVDPRTLPTFDILRTSPIYVTTILRESLLMLQPLTGSFDPFRSSNSGLPTSSVQSLDLQAILATLLQYVVIAGGLAGLFVSRRRWSHWVGLVTVAMLYLGGIALGASVYLTYRTDPQIQGRYGLALVPLLILALVASVRGRWIVWGLWALGVVTFGMSLYFMLTP